MMKYLLIFLLLACGDSAFAQDYSPVIKDSTIIDGMVVYTTPDEPAQFVGGFEEMKKYLSMNINYPQVEGCFYHPIKVYLRFIVLKDGSIPDVKIMRGAEDCTECDTEAVRVIKSMPNWIPAKVNGQPVNSYFNLPVRFHPQ